MPDKINSVRRFQKFEDAMKRFHGEMERVLFSAEVTCLESKETRDCTTCEFNKHLSDIFCPLQYIRDILGEHK